MINITHLDLSNFIRNVYDLTKPGIATFVYNSHEEITDADIQVILRSRDMQKGRITDGVMFHMHKVNGRFCNMAVIRCEGCLYIADTWDKHTPEDLEKLLKITRKKYINKGDGTCN